MPFSILTRLSSGGQARCLHPMKPHPELTHQHNLSYKPQVLRCREAGTSMPIRSRTTVLRQWWSKNSGLFNPWACSTSGLCTATDRLKFWDRRLPDDQLTFNQDTLGQLRVRLVKEKLYTLACNFRKRLA